MSQQKEIFKNADAFFKKHFVRNEYIKQSSFLRLIKSLNYYIYVSNNKREKIKATKLRLQLFATIPADHYYILKFNESSFYRVFVYKICNEKIKVRILNNINASAAYKMNIFENESETSYDFNEQKEFFKKYSYKTLMPNISHFLETDTKKIFSLKVIEYIIKIWKNRRKTKSNKYDFTYDETKEDYYNSTELV